MRMLDLLHIQGSLPSGGEHQEGDHDRVAHLNTLIDLSKEHQVAAVGALLMVLQRVREEKGAAERLAAGTVIGN